MGDRVDRNEPGGDIALIARAVLRLARRLRAEVREESIGLSALGLLATLHREGPMPAIGLARAERLQPQSLSRMITALEHHGLIARRPDENDKRAMIIALSPAGRKVLKHEMKARRVWLDRTMTATLSRAERATLRDAAALMLRLAEARPPETVDALK